jgi:hypothetical protein
MMPEKVESCAICGCPVHRSAEDAQLSIAERSYAAKHHYVPERLFGLVANRRGANSEGMFGDSPWGREDQATVYCGECHEELIHNPVLLPADVRAFAELVRNRGLSEEDKPEKRDKIAGRVMLLHEVIAAGLFALSYLEASHGRPQRVNER